MKAWSTINRKIILSFSSFLFLMRKNEIEENPSEIIKKSWRSRYTQRKAGCLFLLLLFFYIYPKWAEWDRSGQARAAREENWYFQHFYFIYFLIWHFHHSASTLLSLKAICFSSRFSFAFFFFFNRKLNFLFFFLLFFCLFFLRSLLTNTKSENFNHHFFMVLTTRTI